MTLSRRAFLECATGSLGVALLDPGSFQDLEQTFAEIRTNLLGMVNEERAVEKVQPLTLDDFATQIATRHAIDMATGEFASHWGRDGLKPYHRYSFAGGTDATQENVSAADNTWSMKISHLKQDTAYLHVRLYNEKPPHDWHRRTILAPQHTHVGFGIAVEQLRLRLVELFVAKHVEVEPVRRTAKPGDQLSFGGKIINFGGKIINKEHVLNFVEVFYEPTPKPPDLGWLREPRPYSMPKEAIVLRPKAPPPLKYLDGTAGVVEVQPDGSFRTPVKLFKDQPGIYTIVAWIKSTRTAKAFPVTEVCIKTE